MLRRFFEEQIAEAKESVVTGGRGVAPVHPLNGRRHPEDVLENGPSQKELHLSTIDFQGQLLVSGRVYLFLSSPKIHFNFPYTQMLHVWNVYLHSPLI